ncbi:MAG: phosphopentomutase [Gemmatimonadaceae bacterium]
MGKRAAIIVLDGVGVGEAPDAAAYGDVGSDTLGHVIAQMDGDELPNLHEVGLGNIASFSKLPPVAHPSGAFGRMSPSAAGKDSTTGHWEIAGVRVDVAFPTYPRGFPAEVLSEFGALTGRPVIGNVVGSGTEIVDQFGAEHLRTGAWIVYTSADSVFQVAAHESVIPLAELYAGCEIARRMLVAPNNVSRVIARPFVGEVGTFTRTANRRDFSVQPPSETLLDALARAGIRRDGVGKVDDLFAGRSIVSHHTGGNAQGIGLIEDWLVAGPDTGFLFSNLVDFDQLYGHRNDVSGFLGALRQFDAALPGLCRALREEDLLFITADHGNDPTTASSDHARENVPVLALGQAVRAGVSVGCRATFADLGATVADWFDLGFRGVGTSFLGAILG